MYRIAKEFERISEKSVVKRHLRLSGAPAEPSAREVTQSERIVRRACDNHDPELEKLFARSHTIAAPLHVHMLNLYYSARSKRMVLEREFVAAITTTAVQLALLNRPLAR